MKTICSLSLVVAIIISGITKPVFGQDPQTFLLSDGAVGQAYRSNIEAVLRDNYAVRVHSGTRSSILRWAFASGEIPPGLVLRPNGTILGTPRVAREAPYQFKLRVLDALAPTSGSLVLEFSLMIKSVRIKLMPASVLKLVFDNGRVKQSTQDESNHTTLSSRTATAFDSNKTNNPAPALVQPIISFTRETVTGSTEDQSNVADATSLGSSVSPPPTVNCALLCNTTLAPDEKKDFIIDANSGITKGRTRFDKHERVRIIIVNKNPFLYDYRITIEDKPVEEAALAAFLKLLPIGEGTFDKPKAAEAAADDTRKKNEGQKSINASLACPEMDTLLTLEAHLSSKEKELRADLKQLAKDFDNANAEYESAKKTLTTATVRCPQLCSEADGLQNELNDYLTKSKQGLDAFDEKVANFKEKANSLKTLSNFVAGKSGDCAVEVAQARLMELADYYSETATKLKNKLGELVAGRKVFTDTAKEIDTILSSENAFVSVYEKGDFDGPTDLLIKVEKKRKAEAETDFSNVFEAKLNFGGGPRFTLAGGFVFSNLEKPEYQRVPAVISGEADHIVGLKENSNSRILPILMLHSRLFSRRSWKYVSGVHFSLGLTAKPDNEGTDPEFLVGPSLSFIEDRLFFTFGGYAGRKQELEGNLTLGQRIPTEFGDELPVSKHYVWKPGFAITYKIK